MTTTPSLEALLRIGPFHSALRAAIRRRGLTLERLRLRLAQQDVAVALSTLSDWQQGRVRPISPKSLRAVSVLEDLLEVPPRSLLALLERSDPSGWPDVVPGMMPGFNTNDLEVVSRHDRVFVDAQRHASRIHVSMVARARHDGVDRFYAHYFCDDSVHEVRHEAVRNCRIGRSARNEAEHVTVDELLFDRKLAAGETWVFEFVIHDATRVDSFEHAQGVRCFLAQSLIEVHFDPAELPTDPHVYLQDWQETEPHRTIDLALDHTNSVHHFETNVSVNWIGIRWRWA
ncbi:hypothetical protein [Lentzea flava]|uniref:Helix-turn-helix domain-containing protein n=1 Tax=Lentzea flava TaxID=103732 RepID=A0ABQ2UPU9_9PSEU|nr:hypothetical protein [Lentzea flava]MCP2201782.1 hypothetical protein [Lentzea flava]GGU44671.1 hypothetical protein GCM10010178_41390 [Lentzea flava]